MDKYQRFSKEWNQVARIGSVKAKTFKEAGETLGTLSSTIIRRFEAVANKQLEQGVCLPKVIAIDEYKGDTDAGKFQLIIANAETHEPIDILPNRRKETIAIRTFKNWQVELINSFIFKYTNGFLEGINNKTKVMKRNA